MLEFLSVIYVSALNGRNGFQISGEAADDSSGYSVASAGDVNGDGFDDVIVSAPFADANLPNSGASYVVFGKSSGFSAEIKLSGLNGVNGFQISGEAFRDECSFSASSASDFNGDGFDDLLIGAKYADANGNASGTTYVVFGKASGFVSNLQLSSLDGANGFEIDGEFESDFSGCSVSCAGDVNGDGFDDLIIGANYADPNGLGSGATYVVFGSSSSLEATLQLSNLNGKNGFQLNGREAYDMSGASVSCAGDVNGDGFVDLLIGASKADPNGTYSGASYVVFGKATGFNANMNLSSLDGSNGFAIIGASAYDRSGFSVACAGDVNGDGLADVIVGAYAATPNGQYSGASYVIFGKASGFSADLCLSSLNGVDGFRLDGVAAYDRSGFSVASAGDVNGDGFGDVIVGARGANSVGPDAGAAYVVFGKASGFDASLALSSLNGANGFKISGEAPNDLLGHSVASAGDVNGDGFDDLIIGAPLADPGVRSSGASYVIFGHRALEAVNRLGTSIDNVINGGRSSDTVRGLGGDDTLLGWEGRDILLGGGGQDIIVGQIGNDVLIGGAGRDILRGGPDHDVFDYNGITDSGTSGLTRDVIRDFTLLQDRIDLSDLGSLTFIGMQGFSQEDQIRLRQAGANAIIEINLAGDDTPEMTIVLNGVSALTLTASDFIL